uniref:AfsR/SARP family transcriptional regulator n=1 Tax=Allorhizocola rhizosphaerae TaxID=1872709 RepID=UPI003CCC5C92
MVVTHGEFNILGCVEVVGPRGRMELTSARQRALVAALALHPGAVVPSWRLVEALWGERPPRTAVRSLHSHVARLRPGLDACGLGGVLQTRDPGYVLAAQPSTVDAWRFEQDAQAGRASLVSGLPDAAAEVLGKALSLWRGGALADAEPTGWTAAQANRLEELRQVAIEDRCEALLCLSRYGDALVELERLLTGDSTRERPVGLHMIALCGYGRPAEALDAFQRLRVRLADELGVDPSPELAELHTAMLRGVAPAQLRAPGSVAG